MTRTAAFFIAFLLALPATADVYTWRDENGVLHYGDLPGDDEATVVPLATRRTDTATVTARATARAEAREASSEAFQAAQSAEAASEEASRIAAEERASACNQARERLRNYINARRLYRNTDDGDREYLNSAEIDAARANAEADVADKCRGS
ncbi:MAG: DUF4124 domain-containing protein [Pseudomonadota bacterium]